MAKRSPSVGAASAGIANDFRSLASHAEALLQATKSASGDSVDSAREHLKESLDLAKDRLREAESLALERGKAALDATSGLVRENPWQALVAAMLLGVVIGGLASASRKSTA